MIKISIIWQLLAILPFYLNDFFYRYLGHDYRSFIAFAYGIDLLAIVIVFLGWRKGQWKSDDLKLVFPRSREFIIWGLGLSLYGLFIVKVLGIQLTHWLGNDVYYRFPDYPGPLWRWVDLTLGMGLVAISEELVFRGVLISFLRRYMGKLHVGLISALIFAGIHWGAGLSTVLSAFLWALLPTYYFLRHNSLYPLFVAHFVTDFVVYFPN